MLVCTYLHVMYTILKIGLDSSKSYSLVSLENSNTNVVVQPVSLKINTKTLGHSGP